jgi:hypothetical protein
MTAAARADPRRISPGQCTLASPDLSTASVPPDSNIGSNERLRDVPDMTRGNACSDRETAGGYASLESAARLFVWFVH